jgi:hypothetical protein
MVKRPVDKACPRATFESLHLGTLTTEAVDKARTDLFRKIRAANRTVFALSKSLSRGVNNLAPADQARITPQIENLSKQLEKVSSHLRLAEAYSDKAIASILDPRPTVKDLERAEHKRLIEEDQLHEKRRRVSLFDYQSNKFSQVAAQAARHRGVKNPSEPIKTAKQ